ncbi:MAG: PqqD family protein [Candidatus Izemoplasmatales bacterium]
MRIKPGYLLRDVAGQHVVVPTGAAAVDFNGIITLNKTGRFLWERLEKGATRATLVAALLETYAVDAERATADVDGFLAKLREHELLLDE